jgi:hypothetical protein
VWTYANIDWPATEACGTWAGAGMTAVAVFLAAQFSEWRDRRRRLAEKKSIFATLGRLFNEAALLISELQQAAGSGDKGIGPSPPSLGSLEDLIGVLATVDVFRLHSFIATERLFQVKRILIEALALRELYARDFTAFQTAAAPCELWKRQVSDSAFEAQLAQDRAIWPHKNRAGEWIYTEI